MNISTLIAKSYEYSNYSSSSMSDSDATAVAGVMMAFGIVWFLLAIGSYVFASICFMRIFKKANAPAWAAWVPFYNTWKILELGGQQGFWAVLAVIPLVNVASAVFTYIAMYHIGKNFGKDGSFVLWAIFLPYVWLIWLAFDKSQWNVASYAAPAAPSSPTI